MKRKIYRSSATVLLGSVFLLGLGGCSPALNFSAWLPSWGQEEGYFAAKKARQDIQATYRLALAYQERDQQQMALEEFKRVLRLDPNHAPSYNGMAISHDRLGNHSRALGCYVAALRINPDLDYVHNNMGYSYLLQGEPSLAAAAFEKAIALNGKNDRYRNNLGVAYAQMGKVHQALAEFKSTEKEAAAPVAQEATVVLQVARQQAEEQAPVPARAPLVMESQLKNTPVAVAAPVAEKPRPSAMQSVAAQPASPQEPVLKSGPAAVAAPVAEKPRPAAMQSVAAQPASPQEPVLKRAPAAVAAPVAETPRPAAIQSVAAQPASLQEPVLKSGPAAVAAPVAEKPRPAAMQSVAAQPASLPEPVLKRAPAAVAAPVVEKPKPAAMQSVAAQPASPPESVLKGAPVAVAAQGGGTEKIMAPALAKPVPARAQAGAPATEPVARIKTAEPPQTAALAVPQNTRTARVEAAPAPPLSLQAPPAQQLFASHTPAALVEVINGVGANKGAASWWGNHLRQQGVPVASFTSMGSSNYAKTKIYYCEGYLQEAYQVAQKIPLYQEFERVAAFTDSTVKIRVVIGRDVLRFARKDPGKTPVTVASLAVRM